MDLSGQNINSAPPVKNERKVGPSFVFWLLAGTLFVLVDQGTKVAAFRRPGGEDFGIFMAWQNFVNAQFAFSLPVPGAVMAVIYAGVLAGFVGFVIRRRTSFSWSQHLAATLILAGGISNAFERLITGGVRDFIYIFSGILNLADFYIMGGIMLLLLNSKPESRNQKQS